ncbi:glycosyltransferase family 2 protein [Bdellovibrio sp. HCB185ZH]|uniref:glycosyltransferase family 2 protein n=1 Tax=Bdellovibrio sp. HCB185ZH TaxID=3394235 RepID=UPI0039A602EE
MKQLLVYVPCYNEEEAIEPMANTFATLHERLQKNSLQLQVVWINDASRDTTPEKIDAVCSKYSFARAIHHPQNKGLVGVLETSLSDAGTLNSENLFAIGILDGDNSHPAEFFLPMIEKIDLGYDLVIASRFQVGSIVEGVPFHRQLLSLGMSYLFRLAGRITNVHDYSCGFRLYKAPLFQKLKDYKFRKRSFACMVELLIACADKKALCCEVPFILRYDQKMSESKMRVWWTIRETLSVLIKH